MENALIFVMALMLVEWALMMVDIIFNKEWAAITSRWIIIAIGLICVIIVAVLIK